MEVDKSCFRKYFCDERGRAFAPFYSMYNIGEYTLAPYKGKEKLAENLIVPGWDKPIMAFAIAFPSAENAIRVEYEVNLLYWEQEYGPSE